MFHTYVRAYSGQSVDFDRASFLMDRELLNKALRDLMRESVKDWDEFDKYMAKLAFGIDDLGRPLSSTGSRAQFVWGRYCTLHCDKYGESFPPDVDPHWDSSS